MFEAQSKNRMGLLIWMSHSCWPSFVWQTYDYYFEPTAGYFGAKKASEPLHIQWNAASDNIEVVNYSAGAAPGLTARVQLINSDGAVKWEKSATLDSAEDTVTVALQNGVPRGPHARPFHPPGTPPGPETGLRQLLLARGGGRKLPGFAHAAEGRDWRVYHRRAPRLTAGS